MYKIFEIERERANEAKEVLGTDLVSRQSITIREASVLGIEKDAQYILVEGSEVGVAKAAELFKDIGKEAEKSKQIYQRIKRKRKTLLAALVWYLAIDYGTIPIALSVFSMLRNLSSSSSQSARIQSMFSGTTFAS